MNNVVKRLRLYRPLDNTSTLINEAAALIEQQAERIKELEAENERLYKAGEAQLAAKHKAEANEKELFNALAALRQRIADAPVVAWVIRNSESDMKGWIPAKVWADGEFQYTLISKEDLQK